MAAGFCPSVIPIRDEIDSYKEFSLWLYNVMDKYGASTLVRDIYKEIAICRGISQSIFNQSEVYIFGSICEGTFIDMSDQDSVRIESDMPVVTKVANSTGDLSFLVLPDRNPGYVKLQKINKGVPESVIRDNFEKEFRKLYRLKNDSHGKVCLVRDFNQMYPGCHRKGPAVTFSSIHLQDFVDALNCGTWPEVASKWLTRERDNGWPKPDQIKKCESLGFLVVPAFHPNSDEKEFQWRISFSHQEFLLVTQFNSVQLKCYILLKIIKEKIINKEITEETLTSYHCKTCMFYVMENTPNDLWVPQNLASCLIMCLRQLKEWVSNDNCPNYFIPEENMFDRIANKEHMKTLIEVLNKILGSDLEGQLEKVLTDEIGKEVLQRMKERDLVSEDMTVFRAHLILSNLQHSWKYILRHFCIKQQNDTTHLGFLLKNSKETKTIGNYTETDITSVKTHFFPFLQLTLLSYNVVEKILAGESNKVIQEILEDTQWEELDCKTGCAKLKQASAMLMLGNNIKSLDVLSSIRYFDNVTACGCHDLKKPSIDLDECMKILRCKWDTDIEAEEYLKKKFTLCVPYFPDENQIVPTAIKYEMIRGFGRYHASEYPELCYQLGTVDAKFLTIFLMYLNHKALGDKQQAIKNRNEMAKRVETYHCTHRETCLNLLGWVLKEEGNVELALQCFQISLKANSNYNAAYWHLCFLICGY